MPKTGEPPPAPRPPEVPQRAEQLVTVETQQEHDLFTGKRVERLFIKLYLAARTSGLLAAIPDRDLKTLITLATYMDKDGYCYPSQGELARALGVSRQMANERLQSLAAFRFQGRPVMLMPDDQDRGRRGKFAGKRYRILPIAGLDIFNRDRRETLTVSSPLDTVSAPTVSSPTVPVPLDTALVINKSQQENKKQQQASATALAAPREVDPQGEGSDVVVSRVFSGERPDERRVPPPRPGPALQHRGRLEHELIKRGVAADPARRVAADPRYAQRGELIVRLFDWHLTKGKTFDNPGGWLLHAVTTRPEQFPVPRAFLEAQERERRRVEREAAEGEERIRRETEERRQLLEQLSEDPDDYARRQLDFYERSRAATRRPPLTQQQRTERLQQYKAGFLRWRDELLAEEPDLAQQLGARPLPTQDSGLAAPDPALEAQTAAELAAWQQERRHRRQEMAQENEQIRLSRSPQERAEDALRGLDDSADALGEPRLTGTERDQRRAQLVAEFAGDRPAAAGEELEGTAEGRVGDGHRDSDPVPISALLPLTKESGGRPFVHPLRARRGSG